MARMTKRSEGAATGRPDATGRSSGALSGRDRKTHSPPKGEPWVWMTLELLASPAWKALSINGRRLVEFLMVEHRNQGGRENGNLLAPYDQLVPWGLTRCCIREATKEAEFLGLLHVGRGGRWAGTNVPSTYRLTFYADRDGNPPTNGWKGKTAEAIATWHQDEIRRRRGRRSKRPKIVSIDGKKR